MQGNGRITEKFMEPALQRHGSRKRATIDAVLNRPLGENGGSFSGRKPRPNFNLCERIRSMEG